MAAATGKEISPQKVKNALSNLNKEQSLFMGKPIDGTVEFPFLQGIGLKAREIGMEAHVFF